MAGNNDSDNMLVSELVDNLGFDPVIIGKLPVGKFLEPGNLLFGASTTAKETKELLAKSKRV